MKRAVASLTSGSSYFEDFAVGQQIRHARGATVGEFENQMLTKLVMNTADAHFNEARMVDTSYGQRLVFGLVTGSMIVGLATQDTAENAIAELEMDGLRFRAPVFHGDSLTAYSEVLGVADSDRDDAGVVHFKHWGAKQDGTIVFEGERKVLVKRRSHWGDR
jgi:acyl dehydratase